MSKVTEALGLMGSLRGIGTIQELITSTLQEAREEYAQLQGLLAEAVDVRGSCCDPPCGDCQEWIARVNKALER